jgi:hypothetical protein
MLTKSYEMLRRLSACVPMLLVLCASSLTGAYAQGAPQATASTSTTLTPPAGLGTVYQTALDTYGDLLAVDYANGALYEYPAGGGAVVTLVAPGGVGSYNDPGIAIDSNNTLYLDGNWNNCLLRIPFDAATHTWPNLSTVTPANNTSSCAAPTVFAQYGVVDTSPYYFQPWALAVDAAGNVFVTNQNSGNFFFEVTPTNNGPTATPEPVNNLLLTKSSARTQSAAVDAFDNVFFVEETDQSAPLPGVLELPAGSQNVASDAGLARVDPNLPAVSGVATDAAGNLYISDSNLGVFFVPNTTGTPNTAAAVLLTPLPATGQVSVDLKRNILYVPTMVNGSQVIAAVTFNSTELGSTATGAAAATSSSVLFGFTSAAAPASFAILEAGATKPDFVIGTGGTCVAGAAQAANSSCTVNVTLSPNSAGSVAGKLAALDGSGNVLASIVLHGTGLGSAAQILPGTEGALGTGLKTPSQVAVDAGGNTYVADPGLGTVELFAKGAGAAAGTSVGTGLTAPTGVATDGAGDVFIADSGNIIEVPRGSAGLNAAGQATVRTGLGTGLNLAADGSGNVYVADPINHRVVKLGSVGGTFDLLSQTETDYGGFNAPSAVAVDENEDLFVADGTNLYEIAPTGAQTTVLTSLTNATGLAVDPSGAVYVTEGGQTTRIPNVAGTLMPGSAAPVATDDTTAASIAIDSTGDLYIANTAAGSVETISADASYNFGTLATTSATASQTFTLQNYGNSPLIYTAFTGTADYTETSTSCTSPVVVGGNCSVTVTFSPGPGDQGTLTGEVLVTGNEANAPIGIDATGVGASLAASATAVTVTSPTVDGAAAVVKVAPTSGSGAAPTGSVTLTITGTNLTAPVIVTGTLAGGTVTLTPPQLAAGAYTYNVAYAGDRTYGPSTGTAQVTVAPGAVMLVQPTMAQILATQAGAFYPYILGGGDGTSQPYDGSAAQYEYTYPVQVVATDGKPLIGQPVYSSSGVLVAMNYGSITYQGSSLLTCEPVPVAADGTAPFSTDCLGVSTTNTSIPDLMTAYNITPVYSPAGTGTTDAGYTNPNYTTVTGTSIAFTALRNPVVSISSNPASLSVAPGSSATATLTLNSMLGFGVIGYGGLLNNYSFPVQLSCDGLPAYAQCSFTYPNPDPSDANSVFVGPAAGTVLSFQGKPAAPCTAAQNCTGPGTVMMTINTNVAAGVARLDPKSNGTEFAAMLGLGLLGLAFGKRKSLRGRLLTMVAVLFCSGVMAGVSGCSTKQLGTNTATITPAGTYTVMVTAKQVGSRVIQSTNGNQTVYGNENQMSLPFSISVTIQ